jgi:hypothetical protein
MSTATLSITYGTFSAPAGTAVGGIVVTFTGTGANVLSQTVGPTASVVTQAVGPDSYTVTAQAVDTSTPPNPIGTPASTSFVVAATSATVSIPVSLIVTVD